MVADAAEGFEDVGEESLVVYCSCQVNVSKVTWIRSVVNVTHARIVGSSVHRLTIDGGLVSSDARWDLSIVDRQCLSD